jgi:hypothetical protein
MRASKQRDLPCWPIRHRKASSSRRANGIVITGPA